MRSAYITFLTNLKTYETSRSITEKILRRLSPKTTLHNISAFIQLNSANFCAMNVFMYNKTYFNEIPK